MFVIELLYELARWVVDDGTVTACIDLVEHLTNDA